MKLHSYIILFLVLASCKSVQYKQEREVRLPELASIGLYEDYAFENRSRTQTIPTLNKPVRVQVEKIKITKRQIFSNDEDISKHDSIVYSIKILDQLGLMDQINADRNLLNFLKNGDSYRVVSSIELHIPKDIQNQIDKADEYYLIQEKEKTLSLELRKENERFTAVDFADGIIVNYTASQLCWGTKKGFRVEVLDIVPIGEPCSSETYSTAKKAKRKTEFKF